MVSAVRFLQREEIDVDLALPGQPHPVHLRPHLLHPLDAQLRRGGRTALHASPCGRANPLRIVDRIDYGVVRARGFGCERGPLLRILLGQDLSAHDHVVLQQRLGEQDQVSWGPHGEANRPGGRRVASKATIVRGPSAITATRYESRR